MAKTTDKFQEIIWNHLLSLAETDERFQDKLYSKDKNIEECYKYILSEVFKSGRSGFADEEIYSMAVHYFVEKEVEIKKEIANARVVVNMTIKKPESEAVVKPTEPQKIAKPKIPSLFGEEDYEA